jgi:hypothetical protein
MAFNNMKAELTRNGVTYAQVAAFLEMTPNNFSLKMNEKIPLTVSEATKIRDEFFPSATLDYLCESGAKAHL